MRQFWKEEEIKELKYQYLELGLSISEFCDDFMVKYPHRTKISIEVKIGKLKLNHTKEQTSKLKSRLNTGEKNGMFGKIGPNNGLTKSNCERIRIAGENMSKTKLGMFSRGELIGMKGEKNPMFGKIPWCKGETKYTNKSLENSGKKISIAQKEKWKLLTDEQKNKKIGDLTLASNKARKDTKIEIIVKEVLEKMNINFIKNYRYSRFLFDFYLIDYNFVIECQGDYWHGNTIYFKDLNHIQLKNIERDKIKKKYLIENNIKSLFIWENEIHRNKNILDKIILEKLNGK